MTHRRQFLKRASALFAALGRPSASTGHLPSAIEEESWLKGLNGRHRQFFDVNVLNDGAPLGRIANYLDVYRDAYGLRDSDVNVVVGAHGPALGFVLGDAMWRELDLGRRYGVTDATSGASAARNIWRAGSQAVTVESLQARGVRFLACRQTIRRLAKEVSTPGAASEPALRATIEHGLLPGVTAVPAMVVAADRAQEAGLSYVFAG